MLATLRYVLPGDPIHCIVFHKSITPSKGLRNKVALTKVGLSHPR